ncbi:MAG TPA: hypothetical protein VGS22_23960 [Thermoanaerobaculia bacterium]|jgi:hypothetical protein|nr:hypothetical protein [Thermoanaerobaculia bacterium]
MAANAENAENAEIERAVSLIVGGDFTPASMSPEGYAEVAESAVAQADAYLDAFERLYLGARFDAELHSRIHATVLLQLLAAAAPERVRALAASLLKQYDAVLVIYDQFPDKAMLDDVLPPRTANYLIRLSERRRELERLAEGP